jgi:hypothetical protein
MIVNPIVQLHHLIGIPRLLGLRRHHDGVDFPSTVQSIDAAITQHQFQGVAAQALSMQKHHYRQFLFLIVVVRQIKPEVIAVLDKVAASHQLRPRTQGQHKKHYYGNISAGFVHSN